MLSSLRDECMKTTGDVGSEVSDSKEYWEQYYLERRKPFPPSLFSRYVAERYLRSGDSLIELGCGNGRDAVFFAEQGVSVTAMDQCENEIRFLAKTYGNDNLRFKCGDFTAQDDSVQYNHIYSRFTIHTISEDRQTSVLRWASQVVKIGGFFFLEFRGKKNELFRKGAPVPDEPDAYFYEGHYRRFIDPEHLSRQLEQAQFEVCECVEAAGFSPFAGTDETFARVIARKA